MNLFYWKINLHYPEYINQNSNHKLPTYIFATDKNYLTNNNDRKEI